MGDFDYYTYLKSFTTPKIIPDAITSESKPETHAQVTEDVPNTPKQVVTFAKAPPEIINRLKHPEKQFSRVSSLVGGRGDENLYRKYPALRKF
jgi:hypothetical protein